MKRIVPIIIFILLVVSCTTVPVGDTPRNALDWPGTYKCDKMTITLRANNTYRAQIGDVEVRSSFHWDQQGQTIYLNHFKAEGPYKKFLVGENVLIPLKNLGRQKKDVQKLIKIKKL